MSTLAPMPAVFNLNGKIIMPLLDRRMERDDRMASFLRDLDAKTVDTDA